MRSVHFNNLREKLRVKFTQMFKVDMELFFRVRKFSLEPSKKVPLDGFWDRVTLEEVSFLVFDTNTGGTAEVDTNAGGQGLDNSGLNSI